MRVLIIPAAASLAFAAAATVAAPAAAQTVREVVVSGPRSIDGSPSRLSQVVSLRDLDLRSPADRAELRMRVRDTARSLCHALGEGSDNGGPLLPSCEQDAINRARPTMAVAVAQAHAARPYASLGGR